MGRYLHLPRVGTIAAPELVWHPSPNRSTRGGRRPRLVFVHVWGGGGYGGVVDWLCNASVAPARRASSHVVYAGEIGPDAGKAAQLVAWSEKAWTQCDLNPVGLSVESADAIWQGRDSLGFARLARMVALLCHLELDACRYVDAHGIVSGSHGFTYHRDAGALGCGHLSCPSADRDLLAQFAERVVAEHRAGGFRSAYGHA